MTPACTTKDYPDIELAIHCELHKVSEWLAANRLSLNVDKSKLLSFSLCQKNNLTLSMNNEIITETKVAKYLGVIIDNKLIWKDHIASINLKLSKSIGILAKIRHFVPKTILRSLYFSFINSHIDYNLLNWGSSAQTHLDSVNSNIKKAVRIMSFKDIDEPPLPLFKELNILPLDKSIKLRQAKFMWKLVNNHLPSCISNNFDLHIRDLRSDLSVPSARIMYTSNHLNYAGIRVWDSQVPNLIKQKKSPISFTKSFHFHLMSQD